ncbi:hypothetical protein, partial [Ruixingdingia sedimenti]|uniref:hypothetical protein n=1 Tax=Ruixingdingia sedimenti TaxID=3073604 RepID=UPI003CE55642
MAKIQGDLARGRPLRGGVGRNSDLFRRMRRVAVAPFAGAWVETTWERVEALRPPVAPFAGSTATRSIRVDQVAFGLHFRLSRMSALAST